MMASLMTANATRRSSKLDKFDRIDIWRNEVAASPVFCVCSAPSLSTRSTTAGLYKSLFKLTNSLSPDKEASPPTLLRMASESTLGKSDYDHASGRECTMCSSPSDGVVYKWLGVDGSGLMQAKGNSPRPALTSVGWTETRGGGKPKGNSLLKKVSQVFRAKKLRLSRSTESMGRAATTTATLQQRQAKGDAARGPNASATTLGAGPRNVPGGSPAGGGTEMYHNLRIGTGPVYNDEEDDVIIGADSGEGKKPKIAINESAARLRRAQKLLNGDI